MMDEHRLGIGVLPERIRDALTLPMVSMRTRLEDVVRNYIEILPFILQRADENGRELAERHNEDAQKLCCG